MSHAAHWIAVVRPVAMALGAAAMFANATPLLAAELHPIVVRGDAVQWGPAPPSLPPGAQAAVLLGNPAKAEAFVLRLKFPPGFLIPPHRHAKDELVTVISGNLAIGTGNSVDRASLRPLPPASLVNLPGGMPHYAWAEGETIVQINGVGPFDVAYVDPRNDPRKQ